MIASTVMLLPAYTKRYLPASVASRPARGEAPALDLVIAYRKAKNAPILNLLLANAGELAAAA